MTGDRLLPCPPAETLSAYLDGKLAAGAREELEDHLSRCEDCYFVVRETALARPHLQDARLAPVLRYVLPAAAALLLAVGVTAWWMARPAVRYARAIGPLVEAVGPRRLIEARLSGGFQFGPPPPRMRANDSPRDLSLEAEAGRIKARAEQRPTFENRRALAAAQILMGESGPAVTTLEGLAGEQPDDAALQSDLAAAYLTRAAPGDHDGALKAASRAVELDPTLREGWFNQALAAMELNHREEAAEARRKLRELEGDSAWARSLDEREKTSARPSR